MFKGYAFADVGKLTTTPKMAPKPFPGKYPTRIAWEVSHLGGAIIKPFTERYVGKPSYNALLRFWVLNLKHMHLRGLVVTFTEFDMGHVVGTTGAKRSFLLDGILLMEALQRDVLVAPLGRDYRHRYWVQYMTGASNALMGYYHPNAHAGVGAFELGGRVITSAWRTGNKQLGVQRVYVEAPTPKKAQRDNWRARFKGVVGI